MSLAVRDVTHRYEPGGSPVLDDISFTFPAGRSIAIVGPSGSGKTTLLTILGLLIAPTSGAVELDGAPLARRGGRRARLRADIFGWVFQTVNVLARRSVEDNAMLGLLARGTDRERARVEASAALERVGLGSFASRAARSLSGGELQRLCIARALAVRPRFLLADEPTGQLDHATSDAVIEALLMGRDPGTTVVIVTHDLHVASQCDLTLSISDGRLQLGHDV